MTNNQIFTIKEVANYLNCSISTIRNLIKKGNIPYFRIGIKYYFKKDSIDKWIAENEKM